MYRNSSQRVYESIRIQVVLCAIGLLKITSSKKSYDITTNSVTISTIHSTKGFDYACVFLVGIDLLEEKDGQKSKLEA